MTEFRKKATQIMVQNQCLIPFGVCACEARNKKDVTGWAGGFSRGGKVGVLFF